MDYLQYPFSSTQSIKSVGVLNLIINGLPSIHKDVAAMLAKNDIEF